MDIASGVFSALQVLEAMVQDIMRAKQEVRNLPEKTQALVKQVEIAGKFLERLRPLDAQVANFEMEGLMRSFLDDLGAELLQAHEKLTTLRRKATATAEGSKVWATATAYFGQGAARQNKQTDEIVAGIRKVLDGLNQAIGVEDHVILQKLAQMHGKVPRDENDAKLYPVVVKLDELALECLDDGNCKVDLKIAPSHCDDFRAPGAEEKKVSTEYDDRRSAREGGIEVFNSTKIRLQISVEEERFLNVVVYDNQQNTPPELFFPKTTIAKAKLSCSFTRQFPNNTAYKTDPVSFKLDKDANLRPDAVAMQSIYVVLTTEQLRPIDNGKTLKLNDLEAHLVNEGVFVKHFLFDVK